LGNNVGDPKNNEGGERYKRVTKGWEEDIGLEKTMTEKRTQKPYACCREIRKPGFV